MDDQVIFQESPELKAAWKKDAEERFPIGSRVRILHSPGWVGYVEPDPWAKIPGTVVGYNVGVRGEWPTICVEFDNPIQINGNSVTRDFFYGDGAADDEIELIEKLGETP